MPWLKQKFKSFMIKVVNGYSQINRCEGQGDITVFFAGCRPVLIKRAGGGGEKRKKFKL
jgi:hypothetical protein